jgi:hypothetical protein
MTDQEKTGPLSHHWQKDLNKMFNFRAGIQSLMIEGNGPSVTKFLGKT